MKIKNIIIAMALCLSLGACVPAETDYEVAYIYLDKTEGVNFFSQGDVNIVADGDLNMTNTGSGQVEFAFVKDLVYRLSMATNGMRMSVDAVKALSVISPSEGGQSKRMKS